MRKAAFAILKRLLLWIGPSWFSWLFERFNRWLPLRFVRSSSQCWIFRHPFPSYPYHVLIVPKKALSGLEGLQAADGGLLLEIVQTAACLAKESGLGNYRIVVNGGAYQEIPQLHFHLIANELPPL